MNNYYESKIGVQNKTRNFICLFFFFLFGCHESNTNNAVVETNQSKSEKAAPEIKEGLTAFKVLDLEKQAGIDFSANSYITLNELVNKITAKIILKVNYTRKEAEILLETIGNAMTECGIKVIDTSYSINSSLTSKKLCCYGCSFTYLTVAQKLNLPIYAAITPGHIFVIWDDGKNEIWWETTGNFLSDKKYYIDYFKLSKEHLNNLYLRKLTNVELEGIIYSQAAIKADEQIKIQYLTRSLELCPTYESAYKNRGNAKYKLKDYQGACEDWKKVLEIDPYYDDDKFFVDFGCVKNELEDYKGAVEAFNKSIKINPKQGGAYLGRGTAKQLLADTLGAIADYTKVIILAPQEKEAYHNRGIAYYLTSKYKQAISDFDFAIKNGSNDATTFYYRGIAKTKIYEFKGAINDLDRTLSIDPNFTKAYFNRGLAKLIMKDNSGGCADMAKAYQLGDADAKPIMTEYCK